VCSIFPDGRRRAQAKDIQELGAEKEKLVPTKLEKTT
jgi:hypothetical protein